MSWRLFFARSLALAGLATFLGCGDDDGGMPDAGGGDCIPGEIAWSQTSVGMSPGAIRTVALNMSRDFPCADATIELSSSTPGVVDVPETITIAANASRHSLDLTGGAAGTTTLTATWTVGDATRTDDLEIVVSADGVPACSGMGSGMVMPGGSVTASGGTLSGAGVSVPAGASRDDDYQIDPFAVTIACAPDQIPAGYVALGPAVTFGPAHLRFARELPLTVPIRLALLPSGANRGHVEVAYTGPGVTEPRIVPIASPAFSGSAGDGLFTFESPRLGTWQAVARSDAPRTIMREMKFRAVTGVSMGGGGSASVGTHNPDTFDFVAPLGGPTDWVYLLHYIRRYHLGGFCTAEERAMDPTGCAMGATVARTPPSDELYQHEQDFEHWWYEDQYGGQGGTFDRHEYVQIFRDLAMMYGNPNTTRTVDEMEPNITPPGVPDTDRMRSDADRCAMPVVIPTGYYDDEYNPDGMLPAITFCDGAERVVGGERDHGNWDPEGTNDYPIEVALAIDVNSNGRRDPGEPVVRSGHEPFEDCGMDRTCNAMEAGFDPVTNPDPAGDDYDFQFNPNGTEENFLRDGDPCMAATGEVFEDVGLDGVAMTPQLDAGGYDFGEGDGCWTVARGMERMLERNPRERLRTLSDAEFAQLDIWGDGGIRDLFNFAVVTNHFMSAVPSRGAPLHIYNSYLSMLLDGQRGDDGFLQNLGSIDWAEIGQYVMVRYGDLDASEADKVTGDGGHVGTSVQVVNRLLSALAMMGARWPGGDRRRVTDRICPSSEPGCTNPNSILFDFDSARAGRTGPVTVILPPGYFLPEYQDTRYPVIYFGHGYGQEPADLIAIGIILWNYMIAPTIPEAGRLPKMIFVFPDGRCREDECLRGTFYTDAPPSTPNGAQMEAFLLDLVDYMDATYRTRSPETVEYQQ